MRDWAFSFEGGGHSRGRAGMRVCGDEARGTRGVNTGCGRSQAGAKMIWAGTGRTGGCVGVVARAGCLARGAEPHTSGYKREVQRWQRRGVYDGRAARAIVILFDSIRESQALPHAQDEARIRVRGAHAARAGRVAAVCRGVAIEGAVTVRKRADGKDNDGECTHASVVSLHTRPRIRGVCANRMSYGVVRARGGALRVEEGARREGSRHESRMRRAEGGRWGGDMRVSVYGAPLLRIGSGTNYKSAASFAGGRQARGLAEETREERKWS
ncbi:hypothetical protein DFH09DRAFT_1464096 [Mycena vulgaris]|nr:hypothetical protein DFH09DRAFT_1464096 [Mycena vulgaris]